MKIRIHSRFDLKMLHNSNDCQYPGDLVWSHRPFTNLKYGVRDFGVVIAVKNNLYYVLWAT